VVMPLTEAQDRIQEKCTFNKTNNNWKMYAISPFAKNVMDRAPSFIPCGSAKPVENDQGQGRGSGSTAGPGGAALRTSWVPDVAKTRAPEGRTILPRILAWAREASGPTAGGAGG